MIEQRRNRVSGCRRCAVQPGRAMNNEDGGHPASVFCSCFCLRPALFCRTNYSIVIPLIADCNAVSASLSMLLRARNGPASSGGSGPLTTTAAYPRSKKMLSTGSTQSILCVGGITPMRPAIIWGCGCSKIVARRAAAECIAADVQW